MATSFQVMMTRLGLSLAVCLMDSAALTGAAMPLGDLEASDTPTEPVSVSFQTGVNGYAGIEASEVSPPCTNGCPRPQCCRILVDLNNAGAESQGLLRFNGIFGSNSSQIPLGATILSATLVLQTTSANGNGDPVNLHRMLLPWSEKTWDLWTAFTNGVQADGIEARTTVDAVILSKLLTVPFSVSIDVTPSVRAWADGEANNGWVLLSTGADGYKFDSWELATGPTLRVVYVVSAPLLTVTSEAGDIVFRWPSDPSWELVRSQSVDGTYTPVPDNPSGTFVIPHSTQPNSAVFFRLRVRATAH